MVEENQNARQEILIRRLGSKYIPHCMSSRRELVKLRALCRVLHKIQLNGISSVYSYKISICSKDENSYFGLHLRRILLKKFHESDYRNNFSRF